MGQGRVGYITYDRYLGSLDSSTKALESTLSRYSLTMPYTVYAALAIGTLIRYLTYVYLGDFRAVQEVYFVSGRRSIARPQAVDVGLYYWQGTAS